MLFQTIDINNDGVLTRNEVIKGSSLINMSESEASAFFDTLDINKNGNLSFAEITEEAEAEAKAELKSTSIASSARLRKITLLFKTLDINNDGVLTREEVVEGALLLGMSKVEAGVFFDLIDRDGDGALELKEVELVRPCS